MHMPALRKSSLIVPARFAAWTFVALALVYAAVGPAGALYDNPLACLGLGLIGLGMIVETRRHLTSKHLHTRTG